jgi:flagellar motility protein MotE (MotC chaperone)
VHRFIRVLPVTICVAALFLALKLIEVGQGTSAFFVSRVNAEQQEVGEKPPKPKEEAKEEKKEEAKPKDNAAEKDKEKPAEAKEEAKKEGEGEGEGKEKAEKNPAVSDTPGDISGRHFSQSEIDLLQNLAKRRQDLERWERNIQVKEEALNATEKRINEKIEQINEMKKAVAELLAQYNTQEETKLKSLVKIYENMKPDDAARIFDEVEMPVLLLVIDKMAEKKAAPILARMNSKKAKQITVELAEQRRLNTNRLNANAVPKPAAP